MRPPTEIAARLKSSPLAVTEKLFLFSDFFVSFFFLAVSECYLERWDRTSVSFSLSLSLSLSLSIYLSISFFLSFFCHSCFSACKSFAAFLHSGVFMHTQWFPVSVQRPHIRNHPFPGEYCVRKSCFPASCLPSQVGSDWLNSANTWLNWLLKRRWGFFCFLLLRIAKCPPMVRTSRVPTVGSVFLFGVIFRFCAEISFCDSPMIQNVHVLIFETEWTSVWVLTATHPKQFEATIPGTELARPWMILFHWVRQPVHRISFN